MFFDQDDIDGFAKLKTTKAKRYDGPLKILEYKRVDRPFVSPWTLPVGSAVANDCEVYRNYFLAAFKHIATGQYFYFEGSPDSKLDREGLLRALYWFKIVTFNGRNYDFPIMERAVDREATLSDIKDLSDEIILEDKRLYNRNAKYNHIDLIEVAPLEASLKLYAGRMHCRRMQDLPIDPHAELTREQAPIVRDYCFNDLDNTELLWFEVADAIMLREKLGEMYSTDLRSKSDAQIAEAVINSELKKLTGFYPKKPDVGEGYTFKYEAPEWLQFRTPLLRQTLDTVCGATFFLDGIGSPVMPEELSDLTIKIGDGSYKMGMGGVHSNEKSIAHKADADTLLIDTDVESYYPRIILNCGLYPQHLGRNYLIVYGGLVDRRLAAKDTGDKKTSDSLKITINGTFGKQGNMYSTIYAPKLLIQTTMTGQLALLMLIEAVELARIPVISANTDGFIVKCPRARYDEFIAIVRMWEAHTHFKTEETRYKAVYSRDINNYIAVKEKGGDPKSRWFDEQLGCKAKGTYCERGSAGNSVLSKNPEALVCSDAVLALVATGVPIEDTIRACTDIRRFVLVRNVKGGAHKDGYYLGKVVRWYYAKDVHGIIRYILSGNKVPNTEGAKPYMELTDFPEDVNYSFYVDRAYGMLDDIGYFNRGKQRSLF